MITQSKLEATASKESWAGIDDRQFGTQRSGGGILGLLLFPLIAFSALLFAASELAQ